MEIQVNYIDNGWGVFKKMEDSYTKTVKTGSLSELKKVFKQVKGFIGFEKIVGMEIYGHELPAKKTYRKKA